MKILISLPTRWLPLTTGSGLVLQAGSGDSTKSVGPLIVHRGKRPASTGISSLGNHRGAGGVLQRLVHALGGHDGGRAAGHEFLGVGGLDTRWMPGPGSAQSQARLPPG